MLCFELVSSVPPTFLSITLTRLPFQRQRKLRGKGEKTDLTPSQEELMCTALRVTKTLPDVKVIPKNIDLCLYPGAKIGVFGLNQEGKSALLKIMVYEDISCSHARHLYRIFIS